MKKELDILIIEDVAHDAEFIEAELREAGLRFRTRRICTREAFLAALNDAHPDIILSDFTLPTFNALEALQILRKLTLDIPFILVTGTRSEEVAVECIREGADDYILATSVFPPRSTMRCKRRRWNAPASTPRRRCGEARNSTG